jgi:hypothetical protein
LKKEAPDVAASVASERGESPWSGDRGYRPRMRFNDHEKRVAYSKYYVKDNYLVILMMARFVTRRREVTWDEGVAGGGGFERAVENAEG